MSTSHIGKALRRSVRRRARHRCGYCLTQEIVIGAEMEIDHIVPEALGGLTEEDNLWLACSGCNAHKGDRIIALDPETGEVVRLYDPRRDAWSEHFAWSGQGDRILGRTTIGRATVAALQLNRPALVVARRIWIKAGWHPPAM